MDGLRSWLPLHTNGVMVLGGTVVVAFVVWGGEMSCGDLLSSFFVVTSGILEYGS